MVPQTPSQTLGPFFHIRLGAPGDDHLVPADDVDRIEIVGRLLDGDRQPVEDGLIELWQANRAGRYRHPHDDRDDEDLEQDFTGFGRAPTDAATGEYRFVTARPGRVPHPDGLLQAPHLNLVIQGRGMLNPLFTRVYFPDEGSNEHDPVLKAVPPKRRSTLLAERVAGDVPTYRFDIRFQGEDETVFLDF